jgi:hypothetical protein
VPDDVTMAEASILASAPTMGAHGHRGTSGGGGGQQRVVVCRSRASIR